MSEQEEKIVNLFRKPAEEKTHENYADRVEGLKAEIKALPDDRLIMALLGNIMMNINRILGEVDVSEVLLPAEAMARSCKTSLEDILTETDLLK